MDATALEQRLRDRPDDVAAWRAYGVSLREQGDARGKLIELQQRHACVADTARREELAGEIGLLMEEHRAGWDAELPTDVTVEARRHGFATKVAVEWSDEAPALIERALRSRFVTALRIKPGVDEVGEDWGNEEEHYDEDGIPIAPPPIEADALATLDLGRLVELDLSYFRIGDPGAKALTAAAGDGRIETLDLRYCGMGDVGLAALTASPNFAAVRRLHLQGNTVTAEGVRSLGGLRQLVELDLRYNRIGEDGVDALLAAPFIGSLKRLLLYRDDVSDTGVQKLASAPQLPTALRSFWRSV
ncbi:hypothetical protein FCH28_07835 [Streptomyces piniterrae]|uniref:Leucine-rich repeat domain-containing protein n=1 Tax=Streptomyces piniterrae TaxID=2571125 RepID=A0A4U0NRV5_9ACTN|nr:hypothetical protein [Streptomyces piniterrae]TJZ57329.1 hypothetical protein FCH28_07835 [Streptomyces piniterrae]